VSSKIGDLPFACEDPRTLAASWAEARGYVVEPVPPEVVLDSPDVEAEAARLVSFGATLVARRSETFGDFTAHWIVMNGPEGNGFCLQG